MLVVVSHSRTNSVVKSLSLYVGGYLSAISVPPPKTPPRPESKLGLCGTRTQTDGTGAVRFNDVDVVVVLMVVAGMVVVDIAIVVVTFIFTLMLFVVMVVLLLFIVVVLTKYNGMIVLHIHRFAIYIDKLFIIFLI